MFGIFLLSFTVPRLVYFFFNDTATTEIYTLSLHDALPISTIAPPANPETQAESGWRINLQPLQQTDMKDRKSTRLNSSHANISYAVFCLKKKNIMFTDITYLIIDGAQLKTYKTIILHTQTC